LEFSLWFYTFIEVIVKGLFVFFYTLYIWRQSIILCINILTNCFKFLLPFINKLSQSLLFIIHVLLLFLIIIISKINNIIDYLWMCVVYLWFINVLHNFTISAWLGEINFVVGAHVVFFQDHIVVWGVLLYLYFFLV
jgi:hypothetical protein